MRHPPSQEAQEEWRDFRAAIALPQPAQQTFSNTALMLIYLMLGRDALRNPEAEALKAKLENG